MHVLNKLQGRQKHNQMIFNFIMPKRYELVSHFFNRKKIFFYQKKKRLEKLNLTPTYLHLLSYEILFDVFLKIFLLLSVLGFR